MEVHTLKPLDEEAILVEAARTRAVVTVEEHNIIGGLGSAVAERGGFTGRLIRTRELRKEKRSGN